MPAENSAREIVLACVNAINNEDFELVRRYLSDNFSFVGVLGSRSGADNYINDMRSMRLKYDLKKVFADQHDVCLFYDLSISSVTIFCSAWYQVEGGKIQSLKVIFDPRPLLGQKAA